ncbi:MAG: hypothetical protein ABI182_07260 [Candidatus Baltobacteraceae bacterium]
MRNVRTLVSAVLTLALAAGCTSNPKPSAQQAIVDRETAAIAPSVARAKTRYKSVVMGSDIRGSTLLISIDAEGLSEMDTDAEDGLLAGFLTDWKRVWLKANPGKHAKLVVEFQNYYGQEEVSRSAKV